MKFASTLFLLLVSLNALANDDRLRAAWQRFERGTDPLGRAAFVELVRSDKDGTHGSQADGLERILITNILTITKNVVATNLNRPCPEALSSRLLLQTMAAKLEAFNKFFSPFGIALFPDVLTHRTADPEHPSFGRPPIPTVWTLEFSSWNTGLDAKVFTELFSNSLPIRDILRRFGVEKIRFRSPLGPLQRDELRAFVRPAVDLTLEQEIIHDFGEFYAAVKLPSSSTYLQFIDIPPAGLHQLPWDQIISIPTIEGLLGEKVADFELDGEGSLAQTALLMVQNLRELSAKADITLPFELATEDARELVFVAAFHPGAIRYLAMFGFVFSPVDKTWRWWELNFTEKGAQYSEQLKLALRRGCTIRGSSDTFNLTLDIFPSKDARDARRIAINEDAFGSILETLCATP